MYYSTLYNCISNQTEDNERKQRVGHAIIKRLLRIEGKILAGIWDTATVQDDFLEGLYWMLGGMNVVNLRNVISSTMAHFSVCTGGTQFNFSHDS